MVLGMAGGAPVGRAGVSRGPELAKPVLSHHGTHCHLTCEPSGAAFEGASGLPPDVPRGGSSPADHPHLGARACGFPYSHPVSDHLLGQALRGDEKETPPSIPMAIVTRKGTDCIAVGRAQS